MVVPRQPIGAERSVQNDWPRAPSHPTTGSTGTSTVRERPQGLLRLAAGRGTPQRRHTVCAAAAGLRGLPEALPSGRAGQLFEPSARAKETSTRRFFLRPSSEELSAIGYCSP